MESVRVNSELKKVNVTIWQWLARVVPILYVIISLLLHYIGLETLKDKAKTDALEIIQNTIEEAKLRRIELQKHRHLQSAYQQKERY